MPSNQLDLIPTARISMSEYIQKLTSLQPQAATLLEACTSENFENARAADSAYYDAYLALNLPSKENQPQGTQKEVAFADQGRAAARGIYNDLVSDLDSMRRTGGLAKTYIDWVASATK